MSLKTVFFVWLKIKTSEGIKSVVKLSEVVVKVIITDECYEKTFKSTDVECHLLRYFLESSFTFY